MSRECLPSRALLALQLALGAGALTACADDADDEGTLPECVVLVPSDCEQLYPAEWSEVWENTIEGTCTSQGMACHFQEDASGAQHGGLVLREPDEAHELLTVGEDPLVIAGDSACSPFFVRLATDDPEFRMPPGSSGIDERALCSIAAWIDEGAEL